MTDTTATNHTEFAPLSAAERAEMLAVAEAAQQGRWWWGGNLGHHRGDVELHAVVPGDGFGVVDVLRQHAVDRTPADADAMFAGVRDVLDLDEADVSNMKNTWLYDEYKEPRTDNRLAFADPVHHFVTPARELAVFEVARSQNLPDDTRADHPKVYRHDVVDVRNVNARHIVTARPEMILRLLADLDRAEQAAAAAVDAGDKA